MYKNNCQYEGTTLIPTHNAQNEIIAKRPLKKKNRKKRRITILHHKATEMASVLIEAVRYKQENLSLYLKKKHLVTRKKLCIYIYTHVCYVLDNNIEP